MTTSSRTKPWATGRLAVLLALLLLAACSGEPKPGEVQDEARLAGRDADSFPHADEDYFHDMDRTGRGPVAVGMATVA